MEHTEVIRFVQLEGSGKFFQVDQRHARTSPGSFTSNSQQGPDTVPYMNIWGSTTRFDFALTSLRDSLRRLMGWRCDFAFIIEARNKTQVANYLVSEGFVTEFNGALRWPNLYGGIGPKAIAKRDYPVIDYTEERGDNPSQNELNFQARRTHTGENMNKNAMIQQEKAKIKAAKRRIKAIDSIQDEPVGIEEGPVIVQFQKRFSRRGRVYDYAAIKAGDGLWYTTGPSSPKGYSWDQLIRWIYDGQFGNDWSTVDGIWVASEFVPVI